MNTLPQIPLPLFYTLSAVLGLLIGSFLNVVIRRLPVMIETAWRRECHEFLETAPAAQSGPEPYNLLRPGSSCPHCGHRITPIENIPVLSYLLLRGKCSGCNNGIPLRYPLVETLTALLTVLVVINFGVSTQTFFACLFTWALVSLSFIDIDHQLLPDSITLPALWLGLICNYFGLFADLYSALMGAVAGYGIFWLIHVLFKLITGKEGMGLGDLKLLAMLGAWTGWQALASIIFISSLLGSLAGIYLVYLRGRQGLSWRAIRQEPAQISFGPFLALAGWLSLVWGLNVFHYLNLPGGIGT